MDNQCVCCNKPLGFFARKIRIKNSLVCGDCAAEAGLIKNRDYDDDFLMFTDEMVCELRQQNLELMRFFQRDAAMKESKMDGYIQFNDTAKCFMLCKTPYCRDIYRYDQIHAFHLIDSCSGGYCRNMRIKITLTDSPRSCVFLPLIRGDVSTHSSLYTSMFATAHEITARLAVAKHMGRGNHNNPNNRRQYRNNY